MSERQEGIVVNTDLIGRRCVHEDGSGANEGVIRGVFIHRNTAGTPEVGYLIEKDSGFVTCRWCGSLKLLKEPELLAEDGK